MDISLTTVNTSTSPPTRRDGPSSPTRDAWRPVPPEGTSAQMARQAKDARRQADASPGARQAETARVSLEARIKFEYEQSHRVMRFHDSQEVLIYQVPSKGALQLILQEEISPDRIEDRA